ncbi:MAG TPA: DUF1501 domain-containing protein [Polyangiaceae bacterium]
MKLSRRRFLLVSGAATASFTVGGSVHSQEETCGAEVPFVITVQASGAWDPTFLIDPVAGNAGFTPFSADQLLSVGQLRYAPHDTTTGVVPYLVGPARADFFAKHAQRLLVFNGIDNATVSHDVGPRVAFTGATREGLPSISGLVAGLKGQEKPLAMFVAGGFASTGGLVPITRGGSLTLLRNLASPNRDAIHHESVDVLLRDATRRRDLRARGGSSLPRTRLALEKVFAARSGVVEDQFRQISEVLSKAADTGRRNALADVAAGVLPLMSSGACAAAHLSTGGFDTHDNHDSLTNGHRPAMLRLLDGLDYIIDAAAADPVLSARGVLIIVASDFGRTRYNDSGGKDHWPITSMLTIGIGPAEKIAGGARVIGATDPSGTNGVTALPVKVSQGKVIVTAPDDPEGFKLTPAHVHVALRNALGLCENGAPGDPLKRFRLNVLPQEPLPIRA